MSVQIREIVENFPDLLTVVRGDSATQVVDLQTGATASSESLIFVSNRQQYLEAKDSAARVWVVSPDLIEHVPEFVPLVLRSPSPALALAGVARRFFPQTRHHKILAGPDIHPSAHIAASARVGAGCKIAPGVVIGEDCEIGEGCIIGANTVIEPGVKIGAHSHIHPLVFIAHGCQLGARCEIQTHTSIGNEGFGYAQDKAFNHHRITHYGRVVLEDDVHIGAGVQIDRGTFGDSRIGAGTKIDNHCHFGHNIQVGQRTLITGGMITAGSVTIGSYCVIGGRTTVKGHISLADRTHFGGMSVVGKSVDKPGEYAGFPLQTLREDMRVRATIKELPELAKNVKRILKHLGLKSST